MIKILPNFVSNQECNILSNWILQNHHSFVDARMEGIRKTTRYLTTGIQFPKAALEIREKVRKTLQLEDMVRPPFINGMVASYAEPGDTCYTHKDPEWVKDHHTLHCNVIVQKPQSGGNVVIEGKEYDLPEGDLICYYVSNLNHGVTEVLGNTPRLMWIFGFCVEKENYAQY